MKRLGWLVLLSDPLAAHDRLSYRAALLFAMVKVMAGLALGGFEKGR